MILHKEQFGKDFSWGVATAAYQIEGACNADGKGPSIWDDFVKKRKKIFNGDTGEMACEFYARYANDLTLLYSLNVPNFRFSISWSRIMPHGTGQLNTKGIDFYNRVIDFCLELGIEPWITLYHWDLPLELEKKGGWRNREVVDWFRDYVTTCTRYFGDRVKKWMILNEPMVFTGAGYFLGIHAPGRKGLTNFLAAAHHAALCQAEGGRLVRLTVPHAKIGTTFSCSQIEPYRDNDKDRKAAIKVDALLNRLFVEPLNGMGYPFKDLPIINRIQRFMRPGDEKLLAFNMDFIGLQNYTREMVSHAPFMPFVKARIIKAQKRRVDSTEMNWEVYPPAIYHMLKKFSAYNFKEIIVTENGAAFPDLVNEGKVNDQKRMKFIQDNLQQLLQAKQEGVNVNGYFVWTLMDNFEWAEGFFPRFGIVYVDFKTQERVIKSSGHWYREFLGT